MRQYLLALGLSATAAINIGRCQSVSTLYGTSYQVNVDAAGHNIPGDAANESSLCIDPTNPNRIAVGWRQFYDVNSDFREAGWAYSTNGGVNWIFPGVIDTNTFRSDPVLASDAEGRFYYLGVLINDEGVFSCDLWQSTNGGADWASLGPALGGDKDWMAIDTSSSSGHDNLYITWSPFFNFTNNNPNMIFSRSTNGGRTWMDPIAMPRQPYFGTLDIGPDGEVYTFGSDSFSSNFVLNRSSNARDPSVTPNFELTTEVNLGGSQIFGTTNVNPDGLLGQGWVAVDRSTGPMRGNVYVLCTVAGATVDPADVMFARSTDRGQTFSRPIRINDDVPTTNSYHWFGTLAVAPNGRIDVCWNDTRHDPRATFSELFYSFSLDGGRTWSPNHAVSPPFNHTLGYPGIPPQEKMGDYIGIISLNDSACIAYAATFNGEEDIFFLRLEAPIVLSASTLGNVIQLSWNSLVGRTYCVQAIASVDMPWSAGTAVGCVTATNAVSVLNDPIAASPGQRFYRVVEQP